MIFSENRHPLFGIMLQGRFAAMVENKFASSIGNGNTIVEPRALATLNSVPR